MQNRSVRFEVSLEDYGWNPFFSQAFDGLESSRAGAVEPARIVLVAGALFELATGPGEVRASLAGRLRHQGTVPGVGDWVAVDAKAGRIEEVLPRRTKLSRKGAGKRTEEQIVAANVDVVFAVMGLDSDFNPRRLERFLATVWESGAKPSVLLTKLDLCAEVEARRREVEEVALGVEVLALSSLDGRGLDEVRRRLRPRETSVLVGSSGVGKSTLINRLLGSEVQSTAPVREWDDRGRHTTSHRELFVLPGGALLIDNPGVREVGLWGGEESLERTFEDVLSLAMNCRFRDCAHDGEPGCAVLEGVRSGTLPEERLSSYRALEKELHYLRARQDQSVRSEEKRKWRAIHREMRRSGRHRRT
jgi:ribosome biogenesis GTPase